MCSVGHVNNVHTGIDKIKVFFAQFDFISKPNFVS